MCLSLMALLLLLSVKGLEGVQRATANLLKEFVSQLAKLQKTQRELANGHSLLQRSWQLFCLCTTHSLLS